MSNQAVFLGGGFLHQATVVLTDAQIKALPTTPVNIVEAQGANTIILFSVVSAVLTTTAGAYDAPDAVWSLKLGVGDASGFILSESILEATAVNYMVFPGNFFYAAGAGVPEILMTPKTVASVANQPLQIWDSYNGASDYTLGNAANTLRVSVAYYVLNTQSGLFV